MPDNMPPPDECAICGTAIPRRAKACPHCGADERTGWREQSIYDGLDLPEEAWRDDAEKPRRHRPSPRPNGIAWYWWLVAAILMALFIGGALGVR